MNKLIDKAINHYRYNQSLNFEECDADFIRRYNNFTDKDTLRNYPNAIFSVLGGIPHCTHIAAKNLLFQENMNCWKYFERTALFWTMALNNDPWIDHSKTAYEYSLYVERKDLLEILFQKTKTYLSDPENIENREFSRQKVYPSTQLVHFLIEKWLGHNPVKEKILQYGEGYGIYQPLIDSWTNLSKLSKTYWDQLCDYHLKGLSLFTEDKRNDEEFLGSGLVPMELINIIKVRKKAALDLPIIDHPLFHTPMAKEPSIPTGYDQELDVKFQMVSKTVKEKKKLTVDSIVSMIKSISQKRLPYSVDEDIFYR